MENIVKNPCWFCGEEMIWNADFDNEDYGYEYEGMVAVLVCSGCGAMAEYHTAEPTEEK